MTALSEARNDLHALHVLAQHASPKQACDVNLAGCRLSQMTPQCVLPCPASSGNTPTSQNHTKGHPSYWTYIHLWYHLSSASRSKLVIIVLQLVIAFLGSSGV